ncbi:CotH kinase family protein [Dysgonomonas sp. Marseille-P4677]|uniref:CotH kinase family protein n=1 Tax=Dysgonomonas sp. Marseille-P4677 TaxID=2364790 RepID=UPI001913D976|nr:CotH kinase family protein [Dysgonomonas sp. Marseille-P4677]MBK5722418.1 CotH kinase family protein [Dysgonomonas sp. Marseille-P4677]
MKNIPWILFIIFAGFNCIACNDDKNEITLIIEETSIFFESHEAQEKQISITTNALSVNIEIPVLDQEWCSAKRAGDAIIISVKENRSIESARTTSVIITAEGTASRTIKVSQQGRKTNSEIGITSFVIPAKLNNLTNDINGIINNEEQTITLTSSEWIPNIKNLIVSFVALGGVSVNGKEQVSGVTANSFFNELKYVIKKDNGITVDYDIICVGPMFTGLPVMSVNIDGGLEVVEKTTKLPAVFSLSVPNEDAIDMNSTVVTIRGRGNSTWAKPKKPYRIDFPDKTPLFHLPAAKKWVLLANYNDPTLLMNDVTFELARQMKIPFTHSSIHVELFLNGTYRGNYVLTEQNEIGEGRVNIDKTKGFLMEMDTNYDENYKFKSQYLNLPMMVSDPEPKDESGFNYIKTTMQNLESSLFESNFPNNKYEEYTDVNSLIDLILVNEIVQNAEVRHPKSLFCYKNGDSKIMWGPLWDFDLAFGHDYDDTKKYFEHSILLFYQKNEDYRTGSKFFSRFFEDPQFRAKYKARWNEIKPLVLDLPNYIDMMSAKLMKSQAENFKIPAALPPSQNLSYQELISQMKSWINNRVAFLDEKINKF